MNFLLKRVIGGKIEGMIEVVERWVEDVSSYWIYIYEKERVVEIKKESTSWYYVENSLWKRLWACRVTTELIN
jgi:hypothetical protein